MQHNLKKLEVLKPRMTKRYERYVELVRVRNNRLGSSGSVGEVGQHGGIPDGNPSDLNKSLPTEPANEFDLKTIATGENKELAVKLAHGELRRRAAARKSTRRAGISEKEEQGRRTAGMWNHWEQALTGNDRIVEEETLSQQLQKLRLQIDGSGDSRRTLPSLDGKGGSKYPYPLISERFPSRDWHSNSNDWSKGLARRSGEHGVAVQQHPNYLHVQDNTNAAPEVPGKQKIVTDNCITRSEPELTSNASQRQQSPTYTFENSAYLENGTPLRLMFLPPTLRHRFLDIAKPNTKADLETCGILCGTLISNALFISKLVIPDQESTSDTCEMTNESELFDFVDGEDLMVLGWIHTHPTQTCFMSSRDLHTHCGYQVMMPESIAIVCAPSKEE